MKRRTKKSRTRRCDTVASADFQSPGPRWLVAVRGLPISQRWTLSRLPSLSPSPLCGRRQPPRTRLQWASSPPSGCPTSFRAVEIYWNFIFMAGGRRGVEARARARRRVRGWKKRGRERANRRPAEGEERALFFSFPPPFFSLLSFQPSCRASSPFPSFSVSFSLVALSASLIELLRVLSCNASSLAPSLESRSLRDLALSLHLIPSTSF